MAKEQTTNETNKKDSQSTKGTIFFQLREMHQIQKKNEDFIRASQLPSLTESFPFQSTLLIDHFAKKKHH